MGTIKELGDKAFRDYVSDGVPVTGINEPDKMEIRQFVDEVDRLVQAGVGGGGFTFDTLSQANANLANITDNSGVNILADGARSGFYVKQGSVLVKKSDATLGAVVNGLSKSFANPMSFNSDIVVDFPGLIGEYPAVYMPARYFWANGTDGVIVDGTLPTVGPLNGYVQIALPSTVQVQIIYFDILEIAYKIASFPARMPTDMNRYFHIMTIHGPNIICEHRWSPVKEDAAIATGSLRGVVYDRSKSILKIPHLFGVQGTGAGWQLQPVDASSYYREFAVADLTSSHTQIYIDTNDLAVNGFTSPSAVHITTGLSSSARISEKATGFVKIGEINSQMFIPAAGIKASTIVENQFGCGKDDNDFAERTASGCVADGLSDATSIALGFSRGWRNPTSGSALIGGFFPQARNSGVVFAKFYLEAAADGVFGTPSGRLFQRNADGSVTYITATATLIKEISPRVRQYMAVTRLATGTTFDGAWYGATGPANAVKVFGVQFYAGAEAEPFISDADYPRVRDTLTRRLSNLEAVQPSMLDTFQPLVPPHMHFVSGRPYAVYPDQLFGFNARGRYRMIAASRANGSKPPLNMEANGACIELPADRIGPELDFVFQDMGANGGVQTRFTMKSKVVTLAQAAALDLKLLCIGDSLTNHTGTTIQTVKRLRDMGVTIACIGTTTMTSEAPEDAGLSEPGEGRTSRQVAQYVFKITDSTAPVEVGGEAAYLALSNTSKFAFNPFLKQPTSEDIAERSDCIFNGQIFDMRFYLDRFSFSDPHAVMINLGTNDLSYQDYTPAISNIIEGLSVMIRQTRRALPNAKIFIVWNAFSRTAGEVRWNNGHRHGLLAILNLIHDLDDADVFLVPAYCTVSRDSGFKFTGTLNPETGESIGAISDNLHYAPHGLAQFGEVAAQMIVGAMAD